MLCCVCSSTFFYIIKSDPAAAAAAAPDAAHAKRKGTSTTNKKKKTNATENPLNPEGVLMQMVSETPPLPLFTPSVPSPQIAGVSTEAGLPFSCAPFSFSFLPTHTYMQRVF